MLAPPGIYTATLSKEIDGVITGLAGPVEFKLVNLREGALPGATPEEALAFGKEVDKLVGAMTAATLTLKDATKKAKAMEKAAKRTPGLSDQLNQKIHNLNQDLYDIDEKIYGNRSRRSVGEGNPPTALGRMYKATSGTRSTYGPTQTQRRNLEIAQEEFVDIKAALDEITDQRMPALEQELMEAGAPWIIGMEIPD
jgi:hypothetical protein